MIDSKRQRETERDKTRERERENEREKKRKNNGVPVFETKYGSPIQSTHHKFDHLPATHRVSNQIMREKRTKIKHFFF